MIGFELEAQVLSVSVLYGVDMKWLNSAVVLICKLQICRGALMHALAAGLAWAWSMSLFRKAQPPHSLPSPTQFMVILPTIPNAKLSQEKSWFIHICIYVYYITDIVRLVRIFWGTMMLYQPWQPFVKPAPWTTLSNIGVERHWWTIFFGFELERLSWKASKGAEPLSRIYVCNISTYMYMTWMHLYTHTLFNFLRGPLNNPTI